VTVHVEVVADVVDDLERYQRSGRFKEFLGKLVSIEKKGRDAGRPLGGSLTGWRKIVVGDRNWRIVYKVDDTNTSAVVLAVSDRDDDEVYEVARRRLQAVESGNSDQMSLATALAELLSRKRR